MQQDRTVHSPGGDLRLTGCSVGGYVLVGVISFATAVMITVLCIRLREREHCGQGTGKGNASQQREGKNK